MKIYSITSSLKRNLFLSFLMLFIASITFANTHYVTNTNDTGAGSLRNHILAAVPQDTIYINVSGTIDASAGGALTISNDLTIIGPGPIHLSYIGPNADNAIDLNGANLKMTGIGFVGKSGTNEVIYIDNGGVLDMSDCLFDGNVCGSIEISNGSTCDANRCSFIDITASRCGFYFNNSGAPSMGTISNCTFFNCNGSGGAAGQAISLTNATIDVVNNTFYNVRGSGGNPSSVYAASGGVINFRNNLLFDSNGPDTTNILITLGTLSSQGGNYGRQTNAFGEGLNDPTDNFNGSNNPLLNSNYITDGWGMKYFTFADNSSGAIDINNNVTGLPIYDARRVWRVQDGGSYIESVDAGAVEYSQFTVSTQGNSGLGSLSQAIEDLNTISYFGKKAVVFEVPGSLPPFSCDQGLFLYNIGDPDVIINGFSQEGSVVPGPGTNQTSVTPGVCAIEIRKNAQGNSTSCFFFQSTASNSVIVGLSIQSFNLGSAIISEALNLEVSGCHLGVGFDGYTSSSNSKGFSTFSNGSAKIGSGHYCGHLYHNNRNVISGNNDVQILNEGNGTLDISHNFLGLASDGIIVPSGAFSSSDTAIVVRSSATGKVLVGTSDIHSYNLIGGQYAGIVLQTSNNEVYNNVIGSGLTADYSNTNVANNFGVIISGTSVNSNYIGNAGKGNTIIGNTDGVLLSNGANSNFIYGNNIGVSIYGDVQVGNTGKGIAIQGTSTVANRIGAPGKGNTISNNSVGIVIGDGASSNVIQDNFIGLSADGTFSDMGNTNEGIRIGGVGTNFNKIGGLLANSGNFIGNSPRGILLTNSSQSTCVDGNYIGIQPDGLSNMGNSVHGILITSNSANNDIGTCGNGNLISFNGKGIEFMGTGADQDTVMGNKIGVNINGLAAGNTAEGILFSGGVNDIVIGDVALGCGNRIAFNGNGIGTDESSSANSELKFSGNSLSDNNGVGIDLDNNGQNIWGSDMAPEDNNYAENNNLQHAIACGAGNTVLTYESESNPNAYVQVFKSSDGEEGDSLIGEYFEPGTYLHSLDLGVVLPVGTDIVATFTYNDGASGQYKNTTEFSNVITVSAPPGVLNPTISQATACEGGSPPSLMVSGNQGDAIWYNSSGTTIIGYGANLDVPTGDMSAAGSYNYLVADSLFGCIGPLSGVVNLVVNPAPTVFTSDYDGCLGADEVVSFSTSAGATANWMQMAGDNIGTGTNGYGNLSFNAIATGAANYTVSATDGSGCMSVNPYPFSITIHNSPVLTTDSDLTICNGDVAIVNATASGGGTSYSFNWDNGLGFGPTHVFNPSLTATYQVNVVDENNCADTADMVVTVNPLPSVSITPPGAICSGQSVTYNASISGNAPYTFDWDIGSQFIDSTIANASTVAMTSGSYNHSLLVTDASGCVNSDTVVLQVDILPTATLQTVTDISCIGLTDGDISIIPGGMYTYLWNNSDVSQNPSNLSAGSYTVTMTDVATACVGTAGAFTVIEPTIITPTLSSVDVDCNGNVNGSVTAVGGGGSGAPYGYGWYSDADLTNFLGSSPTYSGLGAGWYYAQVSDANACSVLDSIEISEPLPISIGLVVNSNYNGADISCNGELDGEVQANPSGGSGTYSNYQWVLGTITVDTNALGDFLGAGTYVVTVDDSNGCSGTNSVTLVEPFPIITNAGLDTTVCLGGSVVLGATSSGGTGAINITWTADPTLSNTTIPNPTAMPTVLTSYFATGTDVNGCNQADVVEVDVLALPTFNAVSTDITCNGANDASINITVTSGTPSYGYTINGGANYSSSNSYPNLSPGTNTIHIIDSNNCFSNDSIITIVEPSIINMTPNWFNDTCAKNVGEISISAFGGIGAPYTYSIDNGTSYVSSSDFSGLLAGNYDVISQDGNGCTSAVQTVIVGTQAGATLNIGSSNDISCFGVSDGAVDVTVTNQPPGAMNYNWTESGSGYNAITEDISMLNAGSYLLVSVDGYGCIDSLPVTITEPSEITGNFTATDETCLGLYDGVLDTNFVTGGNSSYVLSWIVLGGAAVTDPTAVPNGIYVGTITDGNGCTLLDTVTVGQGAFVAAPVIDQVSPYLICSDNIDSEYISATGSGASGASFLWYEEVLSGTSISNSDTLILDDDQLTASQIIVVEQIGGCTSLPDTIQLSVGINDLSFDGDTEYCAGETMYIEALGSGTMIWQGDADIVDTMVNPIEANPIGDSSTYYVQMISNGCLFSDSILVTLAEDCGSTVVGNNAFSPDGDGVNDLFVIDLPLLLLNENNVTIVNRWGDIIREFENYNNQDVAWDGKNNNGQDIANGTYFYIIEIPGVELKTTGWIQIVR